MKSISSKVILNLSNCLFKYIVDNFIYKKYRKVINLIIIQKIEEMTNNYNDARNSVGKFLLENKRELDDYSMQEIADITYTSRSTLVRVAKMLGFTGWSEFISAYKDEVHFLDTHKNNVDVNVPFISTDDYIQIAGQVNTVKKESCMETLEFLDKKVIEKSQ